MYDIRKSALTLCLVTPANWRTIASHASTSQRLPTLRIRSSRFVSIGGSKIRPTQNFNPPYEFTGVETRTSSPGRPGRGEEDGQSLSARGLFTVGEGALYARRHPVRGHGRRPCGGMDGHRDGRLGLRTRELSRGPATPTPTLAQHRQVKFVNANCRSCIQAHSQRRLKAFSWMFPPMDGQPLTSPRHRDVGCILPQTNPTRYRGLDIAQSLGRQT